ncbi:carcinoembryonic antigen-related cell adhesion molecule 16-like isoform X3 [Xyrichtys novacula]|uniref:Carcinoembryonic antigen-related cell adhesion molecule 16-like isoform X3 n=1 Tax=Xyrichtys novacula TaxID=13765 RepID=A0AAV1FNP3_XYRNO|nr:carcinoembryonic antigen-related cell adhesion molecule 16-like isoform X3 [Xyrichtys novacula]
MDNVLLLFIISVVFTGVTHGVSILPDSLDAAVGGKVDFTTTLSPTEIPFINILWKFGDENIITSNVINVTEPDYEGRITLFPSTGSLELRNLTVNDSGEYTVRITEPGSNAPEGTTRLHVHERISEASVKPSTNQTIEGNLVNLTCDAAGSVFTREWVKDGSDLTQADNIKFYDNNRVLSFQPLNRTNKGVYSCKISNPINSIEANYNLSVIYGPDAVQIKGDSLVNIGGTIELTCTAESEPSASFTWLLNGTVIHSSAVYTKKDAEASDSGNYTCQAKNDITGKSLSAVLELTVTAPPDPTPPPPPPPYYIIGIVIACVVVIGAACGVGFYFYKKKRGQKTSHSPRAGGGGQDNSAFQGNKELDYADIAAFHRKDGGTVQLRPQNETSEYAQVRINNNRPAASSPPTYDAHIQRSKSQAPQPPANGAQVYAEVRKK